MRERYSGGNEYPGWRRRAVGTALVLAATGALAAVAQNENQPKQENSPPPPAQTQPSTDINAPSPEELAELKRAALELLKKDEEIRKTQEGRGDVAATQPAPPQAIPEAVMPPVPPPATQPAEAAEAPPGIGARGPAGSVEEIPSAVGREPFVAPDGKIALPVIPPGQFPWDMPLDFRPYVLDWKDEDIKDIVDDFGRQSGVTILGQEKLKPGRVTYHGLEKMNFYEALAAINSILTVQDLILMRRQQHMLLVPSSEVRKALDPDHVYPSLELFEAANLHDEEIALVFFVPPEGASPAEVEEALAFVPDWVRLQTVHGERNLMQITARAGDIRKILTLTRITRRTDVSNPRVLRFIEIQNAVASQVLAQIQGLIDLGAGGGRPTPISRPGRPGTPQIGGGTDFERVDIAADDAVNVIIVRALPQKVAEIEELVRQIDERHAQADATEPVQIHLRHAIASEVAQTISQVISQQAAAPTPRTARRTRRPAVVTPGAAATGPQIVPDDRTNTLLVTADETDLLRVRALVRMLDVPAGDDLVERVVLTHVTAAEVEMVLNTVGGQAAAGRRAPQAGGAGPRVIADPGGQAVFLTGTEEQIDKAREIIAQLDQPSGKSQEHHLVRLVNQIPSGMVMILTQMETEQGVPAATPRRRRSPAGATAAGTDTARFIADDGSGTLIVICDAAEWPRLEKVITELDQAASTASRMRTFKLVNSNAAEVVAVLQNVFGAGVGRARRGTPAGDQGLRFAADPASNQLFVRADEADLAEIADIIAQIEEQSSESKLEQRIFALTYAQPAEVINVLSTMYGIQTTRRGRGAAAAVSVDAKFAPAGNSVVVFALPDKLEEIGRLIASLDTQDVVATEIRRYVLENVDVNEVARTCGQLFAKAGGPRGREAVPTFVPDPLGKTLLVSAPKEAFDRIEEVISGFKGDRQPMLYKVFDRLEYADAQSLVGVIEPILQMQLAELMGTSVAGGRRTAQPGGPSVKVTADPRGNRLLVAAPGEVMAYAEQLVASLDQPQPDEIERPILRTVRLEKGDAKEMVTHLLQMMQGSAESRPQGAAALTQRGAQIGIGKLKGRVSMVPAPGNKAFVIRGLPEDVDQVEQLIKTMDQAASGDENLIQQYFVADPDATANTILTLLDAKYKPQVDDWGMPVGPFKGTDIAIFTDYYSGMMLVSAPANRLPEIEHVMEMISTRPPGDGPGPKDLKFVEIVNADPYDVVDRIEPLLEAVWEDKKTRPKVKKIPLTNMLSVECKDEEFERIEKLIRMFDRGDATPSQSISIRTVSGPVPPSQLVQMLQARLQNVNIVTGATQAERLDDLIEEIKLPTRDAGAEPGEAPRFVAPASLLAWRASLAVAQTPAASDPPATQPRTPEGVKGEPAEDPLAKILRGLEAQQAAPETPAEVQITIDELTGAIRITGNRGDVERVNEVLDELLEELGKLPTTPEIRVFRLRYASPEQAAGILENMLGAIGRTTAAQQQLQQLQQQQRMQQLQAQQQAAMRRGQAQGQPGGLPFPTAEQLGLPPEETREEGRGREGRGERGKEEEAEREERDRRQTGRAAQQPGAAAAQPAVAEAERVRVYPYERLRALVVRATRSDWPVIIEVLAKIDQKGSDVELRIFQLAKLNAADVEKQLKTLLGIDQQRTAARRTAQPIRGQRFGQFQPGTEEFMQMQVPVPEMADLGFGEDSVSIDWSRQVALTSDTVNNSILVAAPKHAMEYVEKLINQMEGQAETAGNEVMVFTLENADAESMAKALAEAFGGKGQQEGGAALRIAADSKTNTIMVWAPPHVRAQITAHIQTMEEQAAVITTPRRIELTQGNAETVAAKLQEAFGSLKKGAAAVKIVGDNQSRTLLVTATDDVFNQIQALVPQLDQPSSSFTPQIYRLKQALATDVIGQFRELTQQLLQLAARAGTKGADLEVFAATADPRTNSLIVLGGPVTHMLVSTVLQQIDIEPQDPTNRETMYYVLQRARAAEAAAAIDKLFQDKSRIQSGVEPPVTQANESTNTLLVRATKKQLEEIQKLVEKMDSIDPKVIQRETRVFALQFAEPGQTAAAINAAYHKPGNVPEPERVTAQGEYGTRSVIVTAAKEKLEEVAALVAQLDRESVETRTTQLVKLKAGRARELAGTLADLYRQTRGATGRGQVPITVVANEPTNSLIVSAPNKDLPEVLAMVEVLDEAPATEVGRTVKAYRVEYADPYATAQAIRELFRAERSRPEDEVRVSADWGSQSLIVSATAEMHEQIAALVQQMDRREEAGLQGRIIEVSNIGAEQVAQALREAFAGKMRPAGKNQPAISVSNPRGTNRLVVRANEADYQEVKALVELLDQPPSERPDSPRIIPLKTANATQLATSLTHVFTEPARGTPGRAPETIPLIMADESSKSLIVRARPADFEEIQALVARLDTEEAYQQGNIELIAVSEAIDVVDLARTLEQAINQGEQQLAQQQPGTRPRLVTIRGDERASALIVAGSPSQFDQVRLAVKRLEELKPVGQERIMVINLRNVSSDEAKRVLEQMIQQTSTGGGRPRRR